MEGIAPQTCDLQIRFLETAGIAAGNNVEMSRRTKKNSTRTPIRVHG